MIRRLVDWCVPDKALRLGTERRAVTITGIVGDPDRVVREIREGLMAAAGAGATLAKFGAVLVGEHGPEMFVPRVAFHVTPSKKIRRKRHPRPLRAAGR